MTTSSVHGVVSIGFHIAEKETQDTEEKRAITPKGEMTSLYGRITRNPSSEVKHLPSGTLLCLSHKFAANRSRDDRCSNELEIAANGVVPSGYWEWVTQDRRDGVPE